MLGAEVSLDVEINSEDVLQAHRKRLKKAGELGFAVSQEKVPVDRGTLKQSGFQPEFRGNDLVFGYTAPQAGPMETGTVAFTPPLRPLQEWAERIGMDRSFGYVVQQKIKREGIDAQPYLSPASERMTQWLDSHGIDEFL